MMKTYWSKMMSQFLLYENYVMNFLELLNTNFFLGKLSLNVDIIETQLHDGVFLVLLIGLLEGFFIPINSFHMTPETFEERVENVNLALNLMKDLHINVADTIPEDIVNSDLKSTLRVVYALYQKYKV